MARRSSAEAKASLNLASTRRGWLLARQILLILCLCCATDGNASQMHKMEVRIYSSFLHVQVKVALLLMGFIPLNFL